LVAVRTAAEMRDAVFAHLEASTIVIKCAAVADFRPVAPAGHKVKKSDARLSLELQPTQDILAELGGKKGPRILVGFAAETENLVEYARSKLRAKNCDLVVGNQVGQAGSGFEAEENAVVLVSREGDVVEVPRAPKRAIADRILDRVVELR
jgi:phosphopantothenoylcysteine decarboxylase/phosphopantothenate--cysteine ligase